MSQANNPPSSPPPSPSSPPSPSPSSPPPPPPAEIAASPASPSPPAEIAALVSPPYAREKETNQATNGAYTGEIKKRIKGIKTELGIRKNQQDATSQGQIPFNSPTSVFRPQMPQQELSQSQMDEMEKQKKEKKIKEATEEIDKINNEAKEKYKELSDKYNKATTDEERKIINIETDAVYAKAEDKLIEIQEILNGDETPIPVKVVKSIFNYLLNKIKIKFKRRQLNSESLEVAEKSLDILDAKVQAIKGGIESGDGNVNISELKQAVTLAQQIASANQPQSSAGSGSGSGSGSGETPQIPPDITKALGEKLPGGPAPADPPAAAPPADPPAEPPAASSTPETTPEQKGGGISHKRSHPKYINQISENRNKIFKKELEIINSIRRFHRSHTIRKRDKINSILGLRKSRNSKNHNHGNNKNTTRHVHRNNKHKRKSMKHIKKVM